MERSHGSEPVVIKTMENGPYQVKGPVRVISPAGEEYELGPGRTQVLCRCGMSKDKPFCDGSHARNQWVAEPADPESDDTTGR